MATPGYVDVESTIESKLGDGRISVEAPPLTKGTSETQVFKRYPVAVVKPIYVKNVGDSTSCIGEVTVQRMTSWISATSVEVKARQPYDVWPVTVMRYDVDGESYDGLLMFAVFENITYADLVDMAAVFKRYEPENLILDDGRYPALDAFVPTAEFISERSSYATKIRAAKEKTPDLALLAADDATPGQARPAVAESAKAEAATTGSTQETPSDDIEAWFS